LPDHAGAARHSCRRPPGTDPAQPEGFADPTTAEWCRGGHVEAGRVGELPKDDPSQHDHATIMAQVGVLFDN